MTTPEHRLALPPGTRVQDFEFHRVLGHGGFGITYLGWNMALDIPVAIKEYLPADLAMREQDMSVLPKSAGDEADFHWGLNRFLDEARVMARFKHPNIVQVQHYFQAHGTACIVMEYVEGETLSDLFKRRGTLTESELKNILLPLLAGLVEVHEAGILHRDIKPGNISIESGGRLPGTGGLRGGAPGGGGAQSLCDGGIDPGVCADRAVFEPGTPGAVDGHLCVGGRVLPGVDRDSAGGGHGPHKRRPHDIQ